MSDWNGGTFMLTPMAEWAYFRLSIDIWETGKPITEARSQRLLQRAGSDWKGLIDELIDEGKVTTDRQGRYRIRRAEIEHKRAADRYASKSRAAKNMHENDKKSASISTPKRLKKSNASESVHIVEHDATRTGAGSGISPNGDNTPPNPQNDGHHESDGEQVDFLSGIPDEHWQKFKDYRREIGKPLTKVAANRARMLLERLQRDEGMDPAAVIKQTMDRAWVGLFPLKNESGDKSGWGIIRE